jgi:serine/threonine-protein kinase RsbT
MGTREIDAVDIRGESGIVTARQKARGYAMEIGLGLVSQTKLVTAVSELARNMVDYAGGGTVIFERVEHHGREGIRIRFEDNGPGIPDLNLAMQDGYTTGKGLGQGLPGSKRLVNEFEIDSQVGRGTRVAVTQWK